MPLLPRIRRGPRGPKLPPRPAVREARIDVVEGDGLRWLNLPSPSGLEMELLAKEFPFHELDYEDVLSRRQRPKIDEYPEYLFVVLHFPRYDKEVGRLNTAELDVFIGDGFIVTCPNTPLRPLSRLFAKVQQDEAFRTELFSKGAGYVLYRILDELFDYCFPILDKIDLKLQTVEDGIFEGRVKEMVRQISNAKQEIIAFRKIVKPELTTLRVLEMKTRTRYLPSDLDIYFDDVIDAGERIWDILENYKEVIEALEDTNENVVQHRLNDILLVLTILSVIFLPATLITGIWGMNVHIPGEQARYGFEEVVAGIGIVMLAFLGYFKWRKWW